MIDTIRTKIRALVPDLSTSDKETFSYTGSTIFTLAENNISALTEIEKNGSALGSGDYEFDSTTNKLTITASLSDGDIIEVNYNYNKYSDTELDEYVRASLIWLSIFDYREEDYELEDDDIYPTPDNRTTDLISLIASILIKPDYSEYRLPNLTVRYPNTMTKEERIEKLISRYKHGLGVTDVLEWD